jgi:hypothetical protein
MAIVVPTGHFDVSFRWNNDVDIALDGVGVNLKS